MRSWLPRIAGSHVHKESTMKNHSTLYSLCGIALGFGAPLGWTVIRLLFFYDNSMSFFDQVFGDPFVNAKQFAQYSYMGIGTAMVLSSLGYMIGKNGDELRERAVELDVLH